jgi:hypothetical protein
VGSLAAALFYWVKITPSADALTTALVLVGALAGLTTIAAWSIRAFSRNRDAHNQAAEQHNRALQEVAHHLKWQWQPGYGYSHSMTGTFQGWGTITGEQAGLWVQVAMRPDDSSDGPVNTTTVVLVKPPNGRLFDLGGRKHVKLKRRKGTLDQGRVLLFPTRELDPLVDFIDVTPELLEFDLAPPPHFRRSLSYILRNQSNPEIIMAAIAASVGAAVALPSLPVDDR